MHSIALPEKYRQVRPVMDAGYKSAAKYDKAQPTLDDHAWSVAGEWTKEHFMPVMGGSATLDQETVLKEMDLQTSCGYPWNLAFQKKTDFLLDARASAAISDYWDHMILPEKEMVPIWTCSQKRELRSLDKLAAQSHRTFTASPVEFTTASNRVFLDMNEKFYRGHRRTWSYVGATKFSQGWDTLYYRLKKHPNAFELDESAYDSSLFARAMYGQRDLRWSMLLEEERTAEMWVRVCEIYDQIVHSVIIMENGTLVRKHTGNPSGSNNTIVDNTMILYRLFAYAWIILAKEQGRETSRLDFERNVEAALNGDDNTFTVSDEVVSWFNPKAIARVWSEIGVVTNTPCEDPRPLSEVTFLSNGFRYNEQMGIFLPYPETEKVLSSLMYGSSLNDVRWHYLRACALRLDSYGNPHCRSVIQGYIEYLNQKYHEELIGSVSVSASTSISMGEIRSVWKSDAWIELLYSGRESVAVGPVIDSDEVELLSAIQHLIKDHHPDDEVKQSLCRPIMPAATKKRPKSAPVKRKTATVAKKVKKAVAKRVTTVTRPASGILKSVAQEASEEKRLAIQWAAAQADPTSNLAPALGAHSGSQMFVNTVTGDYVVPASGNFAVATLPRGGHANMYNMTIASGSAGAWQASPMAGDAALSAYPEGRLAVSNIRWQVRHSSDTIPGYVHCSNIPGVLTTSDFSALTANQLIAARGMAQFEGRAAYSGQVSWRPLDGDDGRFSSLLTKSSTTLHSTGVPLVLFMGWPPGLSVRVVSTMQIEVLPGPAYSGIPAAMTYTTHDWARVLDALLALRNHPIASAVGGILGKHALRVAMAATGMFQTPVRSVRAEPDPYADEWNRRHDGLRATNPGAKDQIHAPDGTVPEPPFPGWVTDKYFQDPLRLSEEFARLRAAAQAVPSAAAAAAEEEDPTSSFVSRASTPELVDPQEGGKQGPKRPRASPGASAISKSFFK